MIYLKAKMLLIFLLKLNLSNKKEKLTDLFFNGPFQLLHADVPNLEFLGKSAVDFKHCLLFVDLFTSKVYTCPMKIEKVHIKKK